jgi:diadenosine tetraphosphate (Ap4A) HIT family hydrolase
MPDTCLFCDPSRSKILCQNTRFYARYDEFPATPGHVEIVPKRHVLSIWDLTEPEMAAAWRLAATAAGLIAAEHRPDGWNIGVNDGAAAGRTIHHLHIHLIPRYAGDQPDPRGGIRRGLPNGDPDVWASDIEQEARYGQ